MKFAYFFVLRSYILVSTLAVEWIEIIAAIVVAFGSWVSTLAVEWIEILRNASAFWVSYRLHPRGGVD